MWLTSLRRVKKDSSFKDVNACDMNSGIRSRKWRQQHQQQYTNTCIKTVVGGVCGTEKKSFALKTCLRRFGHAPHIPQVYEMCILMIPQHCEMVDFNFSCWTQSQFATKRERMQARWCVMCLNGIHKICVSEVRNAKNEYVKHSLMISFTGNWVISRLHFTFSYSFRKVTHPHALCEWFLQLVSVKGSREWLRLTIQLRNGEPM